MKSVNLTKLDSATGLPLTLTFNDAGAGTGKMYAYQGGGRIVIDITTAIALSKKVTITTPVSFRVLDVFSIHKNGTKSLWTLKNDGTAITSLIDMVSEDDIDRAVSIKNVSYEFTEDDDDLVIDINGTGAALAIWVFDIQFV